MATQMRWVWTDLHTALTVWLLPAAIVSIIMLVIAGLVGGRKRIKSLCVYLALLWSYYLPALVAGLVQMSTVLASTRALTWALAFALLFSGLQVTTWGAFMAKMAKVANTGSPMHKWKVGNLLGVVLSLGFWVFLVPQYIVGFLHTPLLQTSLPW
jgi:hypothetical protein